MRLAFISLALLLAGCEEKTNFAGRNQLQSTAHDEAIDATNPQFEDLNAKVKTLESRVDTLEEHDRQRGG